MSVRSVPNEKYLQDYEGHFTAYTDLHANELDNVQSVLQLIVNHSDILDSIEYRINFSDGSYAEGQVEKG